MTAKVNKPGHRIEYLYAFVMADIDGDEGLPAVQVGQMMMPLIGTDEARLAELHKLAVGLSVLSDQPIELREYVLVRTHGFVPLAEIPLRDAFD